MFHCSTVKFLKVLLLDYNVNEKQSKERACSVLNANKSMLVFVDNYVDGQTFFQLTEEDLLEMIQPIGIVKNVMSLILGNQVTSRL